MVLLDNLWHLARHLRSHGKEEAYRFECIVDHAVEDVDQI